MSLNDRERILMDVLNEMGAEIQTEEDLRFALDFMVTVVAEKRRKESYLADARRYLSKKTTVHDTLPMDDGNGLEMDDP